jgi:cytoskeletal protein CcmA (bactofilin family)
LWDESADSLIVTGTTTLVGTTNLDAVDIDGAVQADGTITVGVDDTGYDVKFFGATTGKSLLWDESADSLIVTGTIDATTVEFDNLSGTGAVNVTNILDEDNMASDSATALATQQSIKAYVDSQVGTVDTLSEILANGNTTGATDIDVDGAQKVQFRDAAIYINSSVDGQLDIVADTEIQIAATTIDINGAIVASGEISAASLDISGDVDIDGTLNVDAIDIDGAVQLDNTLTVGVDDTGYDVKFYGATGGAYMLWDESADDLILAGAGGLVVAGNVDFNGDLDVDGTTNLDVVDIDGTLNVAGISTFTAVINQTTESPSINLTDSSSSRTLSVNVDDNNSFLRASGPMLLQTGGATTAITINASQNSTFAGTVTATGTSVFASLDISGDIDVDGTTNLDVVDIDGAVDMASTLQVTGAANFSDRIGSKYVYPTDPTSQTAEVTNHFWKMGRMTLSGPAAAEIELHGLSGYGQNDQIAGKNIIQLRGSNSATVLDGTFHATGDPGIGIQEMRYVPIGSYVFDLYAKLGTFTSLSTTVTCGGTWAPEWTNTGSGSNPASSVDMPAHYALLLGNNIAMYADLSEVVFNDDSNDIDFRVASDSNANMLFVDGGNNAVGIGTGSPSTRLEVGDGVSSEAIKVNAGAGWADVRLHSNATNGGSIYFNDGADAGQLFYYHVDDSMRFHTATTERLRIASGGGISTYPAASGTFVINENGVDADFRVESDGNANMLFVDGGSDKVGIGRDPQDNGSTLQVAADATASTDLQLALRGVSNENKKLLLGMDTTANIGSITSVESGVTHYPLHLQGSVFVWNESGSGHDFRVESSGNVNMLFVDGGTNKIGVGSVPTASLAGGATFSVAGSTGIANAVNSGTFKKFLVMAGNATATVGTLTGSAGATASAFMHGANHYATVGNQLMTYIKLAATRINGDLSWTDIDNTTVAVASANIGAAEPTLAWANGVLTVVTAANQGFIGTIEVMWGQGSAVFTSA